VKRKRRVASPARDLYTSDLFRKRRAYAEATGKPWFVLSALHGLVSPDDILEPYDLALKAQSSAYQREWGRRVASDLLSRPDAAGARVFEVHAGAEYVDAIAAPLADAGCAVSWPLRGLALGQQLAWYADGRTPRLGVESAVTASTVGEIVSFLGDPDNARVPRDFPWGRTDLDVAGLYSWWVDGAGAAALSRALGVPVDEGLVYAGQAGATSEGRVTAGSTLRSRIGGGHLRGGIHGSTWRKTLAAVLRDELALAFDDKDLDPRSQMDLTEWMRSHLRVAIWPISDRSLVAAAESAALAGLDPPLNLMGMSETPTRKALRQLRQALPRRAGPRT
jgi:hypothetical protein